MESPPEVGSTSIAGMTDQPVHPTTEPERPPTDDPRFAPEELALAARNRGLPLEALRYAVTPSGLHYLLSHFDLPAIGGGFRLELGGLVERPLRLDLGDLVARTEVTRTVTLECAGNGRALLRPRPVGQPWLLGAVSTARWTGTPLAGLLAEAGIRAEAAHVVFTGADRGIDGGQVQAYVRSLPLAEALRTDLLLVQRMNDEPLPAQHGGPLRLIVPGWYGMASVKWLCRIELTAEPCHGHYMDGTYRYRQHPGELGEPVTWQRVRALMVPPGIPDFYSRARRVDAGRVALIGRAWAGRHTVERVELSTDGGASWTPTELAAPTQPGCWQAWTATWQATPGRHTLMARATDAAGDRQPLDQAWNYLGMGNNAVQRVEVTVV